MAKIKKVIGYVASGLGLVGLLAGVSEGIQNRFLGTLPEAWAEGISTSLLVISLILLGVGLILLFLEERGGSKSKQSEDEVPIYEGTGKKRKIVGYRKQSKK